MSRGDLYKSIKKRDYSSKRIDNFGMDFLMGEWGASCEEKRIQQIVLGFPIYNVEF